ncbi:MAG: 5-bromo-4-chloroindolyl phosphate hydrolysis family protein [Blautia massiliensis (ex Durand et al. 2017)]
MAYQHPYKPNRKDSAGDGPQPHRSGVDDAVGHDLDDAIQNVVQTGAQIGSQVLGTIGEALRSVGDALGGSRNDKPVPFLTWRKRMDHNIKNGKQDNYLAISIVGWTFAACFGIADLVMIILTAVGATTLGITPDEFMVFPILAGCFVPATLGFGFMGWVGVRQYRFFKRIRSYLRGARDWVCPVQDLARACGRSAEQVRSELQKAIADDALPGVILSPDGKTLYLDESRYTPVEEPRPEPQTAAPESETDAFRREGADFLEYLRCSIGKLGPDTDEELARMRRTCAAILGFVNNHPEQLPRVRRFREYYLPTTRKLLDTAQGLGEAEARNAQEIRRDITGILHTLNQAYSKLYDVLLQDVSLDVSTEIDTLETMLRQDGLTHDFESDFKNG